MVLLGYLPTSGLASEKFSLERPKSRAFSKKGHTCQAPGGARRSKNHLLRERPVLFLLPPANGFLRKGGAHPTSAALYRPLLPLCPLLSALCLFQQRPPYLVHQRPDHIKGQVLHDGGVEGNPDPR